MKLSIETAVVISGPPKVPATSLTRPLASVKITGIREEWAFSGFNKVALRWFNIIRVELVWCRKVRHLVVVDYSGDIGAVFTPKAVKTNMQLIMTCYFVVDKFQQYWVAVL